MLILNLGLFAVLCGLSYGIPLEPLVSNDQGSRIHGGVDAPSAFAPHMAALLFGDRLILIACGGSIVTRKHMMTAAHCITPFIEKDGQLLSTFNGRVGSNIWHSGGLQVQFQEHFVHPKWNEDIIKFDVGVLSLTEPLEFNDKVAMIGLNFEWVGGDEESYVTGWGTTEPRFEDNAVYLAPTPDELQLLYVKTLTPQQCAEGIQSSQQWASIAPPLDPEVEMCTIHSAGHGVCHGDSGSALVTIASGRQVGIVSWGMPCALGAPDFYTRLRGVEDFLRPILQTCSCFEQ